VAAGADEDLLDAHGSRRLPPLGCYFRRGARRAGAAPLASPLLSSPPHRRRERERGQRERERERGSQRASVAARARPKRKGKERKKRGRSDLTRVPEHAACFAARFAWHGWVSQHQPD
jgi:hypothetical protein